MEDLINLSVKKCYNMKCLILTEHPQLKSGVTIFSKLVELQLIEVDVREICYGSHPNGFLRQLEKLELKICRKLESTLFKDKLVLGNLKSIYLEECLMMYLFHPSTAQSLTLLETLKIVNCSKLKYIIRDEESPVEEKVDEEDCNPRNHDSMFSKLKLLSVQGCEALEFILPICFCKDLPLLGGVVLSKCKNLTYVFGQYPKQGGLHQMQNENTLHSLKVMLMKDVPLFVNIYPECYLPQKSIASTSEALKEKDKGPSRNISCWDPLSCFLPKSETTSKDEPSTSETTQPDHIASQGKYVGNRANGIFTPPLHPCKLRKLYVEDISNLRSLFSISVASSMQLLEELVVSNCDELEHIVTEEVDGHHHLNAKSMFPNLRTIEIKRCNKFEYVKHVFPNLFMIWLEDLPKLHTICSAIDFQTVRIREAEGCPNISLTPADDKFLGSYLSWLEKSEGNKSNMHEFDPIGHIVNRAREMAEKIVQKDLPTAKQNT